MTLRDGGDDGGDDGGAAGDVIRRALRTVAAGGAQPAVIDGDGTCTRDELSARVQRNVAHLRERTVGAGDPVGVLAQRGRDETAALLAVWTVGAVAVPLERSSPPVRNRRILDACGARAVIGGPPDAPESAEVAAADSSGACARFRTATGPDAALVLHTSGSTGVPKGVPVTRAGVDAFVAWMCAEFGVRDGDRVAALAGPSFDLALFEQLAPLASGGAVVRASERAALSPKSLAAFLDVHRVPFVYAVPSLWVHLLRAEPFPRFEALRAVLFAGEPFPLASLRRLRDALPGRAFVNLFGPTETNVCTFHRLRDDEPGADALPIGAPCPYAETVVADPEHDAETAAGELCVRGPTVMRGYIGDAAPARTCTIASRGPAPFLRTGDLVERRAEGGLRFLGRRDAMLKVRGYRVEPGEVEAALSSHPDVEDAVAGVTADPQLGDVLVADVVLRSGATADPRALRAHAAERVPTFMLPAWVRVVPAIERTDRGKRVRPG